MIDNLLSNALKFTPEGGEVTVDIARSNGNARLVVADTGVGMRSDEIRHLFERFYRTDAATAQAVQGSGLGLSICKAIVEAHGGAITADSRLGLGTSLTIELPTGQQPGIHAMTQHMRHRQHRGFAGILAMRAPGRIRTCDPRIRRSTEHAARRVLGVCCVLLSALMRGGLPRVGTRFGTKSLGASAEHASVIHRWFARRSHCSRPIFSCVSTRLNYGDGRFDGVGARGIS